MNISSPFAPINLVGGSSLDILSNHSSQALKSLIFRVASLFGCPFSLGCFLISIYVGLCDTHPSLDRLIDPNSNGTRSFSGSRCSGARCSDGRTFGGVGRPPIYITIRHERTHWHPITVLWVGPGAIFFCYVLYCVPARLGGGADPAPFSEAAIDTSTLTDRPGQSQACVGL